MIVHIIDIKYDSINIVYDFTLSPEGQMTKATLQLKQALKVVTREPLPGPLTVEAVNHGEGEPPELVKTFFRTLIGGLKIGQYSDSVMHRSDSLSQDALFLVKNGNLKPRKHILMGLSLKSLTGSKKILSILNRMGHSITYHAVEEIETNLAYDILNRQSNCPAGTVSGVPCGLAFDNYNELTHILSGSDTSHDTMGILYQTQCRSSPTELSPQRSRQDEDEPEEDMLLPKMAGKKRRRKLDVQNKDLPHYRKKPQVNVFFYDNMDFCSNVDPSASSRKLDFL